MSYTQLLYHIILRTHNSARTITEEYEREPTIESCLRQQ